MGSVQKSNFFYDELLEITTNRNPYNVEMRTLLMLKFKKQKRYTQQVNRFILIYGLSFFLFGIWALIANNPNDTDPLSPLLFAACMFFNGIVISYMGLTNDPVIEEEK